MKWLLTLFVIAVYLLHQDYWNWKDNTLVGGILPMGLAYHAVYAVLASIMMAALVKYAWPIGIEQEAYSAEPIATDAAADDAIPAEGAHQ